MRFPNLREEKKLWRKGYKRVAGLDEAGRGPLSGPVVAVAVVLKNSKFDHSPFPMGWVAPPLFKGGGEIRNKLQTPNIRDSKKLTPKKREKFYKILTKHLQIEWGTGKVSEKVIDKINILEATKLAMKRAINNLKSKILNSKSETPKQSLAVTRDATGQANSKFNYSPFSMGWVAPPLNKSGGKIQPKPDFIIIDGNFELNLPISQKAIIKADEKVFSCAMASIIAKVTRDRMMQRYHQKYPQYGFDKNKGYPTKYHLRMLKKYGPCQIHRYSFNPVKKSKERFSKKQSNKGQERDRRGTVPRFFTGFMSNWIYE